MLNEIKSFFNNIKHFRQILKEGVGDSVFENAINDHKYLYIYYAGDDTTLKGYRTIKPFVLGTSTAGNKVLRAWQENGSSDSYAGLTGRKREDHEYQFDKKGTMKPGWRLFRVDGISSALPTGKKFSVEPDKIPALYNPQDKQIPSIIAAVQIGSEKELQTKGFDSIEKPDVTKQKVDGSFFDNQTNKFKQFFNAAKKTREASTDEIKALYDIAIRVRKKSPQNLLVVANERGDMVLKDVKDPNVPEDSIVGNLKDLYQKLVVSKMPKDDSFLEKGSEIAIRNADEEKKKNINNKTFFK